MGGKSGQVAPEKPVDFITNTMTGLDKIGKTRGEDMAPSKEGDVATKKLGTRGLQIPLQAEAATTDTSAPTTGVNI